MSMKSDDLVWKAKKFDELTTHELYEILRVRAEVFVKEQGINCVDPDGTDYSCIHIFAMRENKVYAYLRAYNAGEDTIKVGRILAVPHGYGLGTELMKYAIGVIRDTTGYRKIIMDAQKQAVAFYEKLGFVITSDEYLEEGIWHMDMCLEL